MALACCHATVNRAICSCWPVYPDEDELDITSRRRHHPRRLDGVKVTLSPTRS
jgi:hypothetical protein